MALVSSSTPTETIYDGPCAIRKLGDAMSKPQHVTLTKEDVCLWADAGKRKKMKSIPIRLFCVVQSPFANDKDAVVDKDNEAIERLVKRLESQDYSSAKEKAKVHKTILPSSRPSGASDHCVLLFDSVAKKGFLLEFEKQEHRERFCRKLLGVCVPLYPRALFDSAEGQRYEAIRVGEEQLYSKEKKKRVSAAERRARTGEDGFELPKGAGPQTASVPSPSTKLERIVIADALDDLPKDVKKSVERMQLDADEMKQHWELLLTILAFSDKVSPKRTFMSSKQKAKLDKERDEPKSPRHRPMHSLRDPSCLKKEEDVARPVTVAQSKKMFKLGECLGEGGFGQVFEGRICIPHPNFAADVDRIAIKIVEHDTQKHRLANITEISYLHFVSQGKAPGICQMYGAFTVASELWVAMELMPGGTLKQASSRLRSYESRFDESQIAYISRSVLTALDWLHAFNIGHRDLKNLNLMMMLSGDVKLIDFGLAADFSMGPVKQLCGSPCWIAPECLREEPHTFAVDIWSYGVCLLEMANQYPPYIENMRKAMFVAATTGYVAPDYGLTKPAQWNDEFKTFLSRCLVQDPKKRATAAELLEDKFLECAATKKKMQETFNQIFAIAQLASAGL